MTKDEKRLRDRERYRARKGGGSVRPYGITIPEAVAFLEKHDYRVVPPEAPGDFLWERPADICERLKITHEKFIRRIREPRCPAFAHREGATGRIIVLKSNFALEDWLSEDRRIQHARRLLR